MKSKNVKVKIKPKFNVGDRVEFIQPAEIAGMTGTVKKVCKDKSELFYYYAVEIDVAPDARKICVHNCMGACEDGKGRWAECNSIKSISPKQPKPDYTWHDLRKNPDDLPKKDGDYLIVLKYPRHIFTIEEVYKFSNGEWETMLDSIVIAWRDYEHFKP